jgi:EAL domain-containing protein (putative c-di-GMP-specific phosphodiesterase class I)
MTLEFTKQDFEIAFQTKALTHYFQPIIDLASGKPVSFEALVRWHHPTLGLLNPTVFIKSLVSHGFDLKLSLLALKRLAQYHRQAKTAGLESLPVAINITAAALETEAGVERLEALMNELALPPKLLQLEMLEWAKANDLKRVATAVAALKALGVQVIADDFGHAYGSFHRLMNVEFGGIKLDSEYSQGLDNKPQAHAIIRACVVLTQALSLNLVVEGVQTRVQALQLEALGVQKVQGFLYYPPMPIAQVFELLEPI